MHNSFNHNDLNTTRADLILLERALSALYGCDCKTLADDLVKRFGSVSGVLCASVRELEAVPMTHRAAALIALSSPVLKQALYRSNYATDCERGLVVETCIEYTERPYPFRMCVYTDECGRLVHTKKLTGFKDVRTAVGEGARNDARHFAIIEYSPYDVSFDAQSTPGLNRIIANMRKIDVLFIDYIKFDGILFRSIVRELRGEPPFDITTARTFRYVCDDGTVNKILSRK